MKHCTFINSFVSNEQEHLYQPCSCGKHVWSAKGHCVVKLNPGTLLTDIDGVRKHWRIVLRRLSTAATTDTNTDTNTDSSSHSTEIAFNPNTKGHKLPFLPFLPFLLLLIVAINLIIIYTQEIDINLMVDKVMNNTIVQSIGKCRGTTERTDMDPNIVL